MLQVEEIRINYEKDPIGTGREIELSWLLTSDKRVVLQNSYHYQLSSEMTFSSLLFDSGWVEQSDSAHVLLDGDLLESAKRYYIRVKIRDNSGEESDWSQNSTFVTSLLDNEWQASFVSAETENDAHNSAARYVRGLFHLDGSVKEAIIYSTALGLYELYINGEKVGNDYLTPGWTSFKKHLMYQTYDVTDLLCQGDNCVGALVGAGWYKGRMGFTKDKNNYGEIAAFLCRLVIQGDDGSIKTFCTDSRWLSKPSPIIFSEIYDGETYDGRLETMNWSMPSYKQDEEWVGVTEVPWDYSVLCPQYGGKVREKHIVQAKEIIKTPKGETVIDFGQNMAGWVQLKVKGKIGDTVELICFETLDTARNVYLDNLRSAKQTVTYILGEDGEAVLRPHFTYQGFRYAMIKKWLGNPEKEAFEAVCLYSDMAETGEFKCSNSLVNRLVQNIAWGMRSNFVDIPSDCPQRDERLGWTGDAQIFSRTASYLMNTRSFYKKWLRDLACDQTEEGGVPHVVPDIISLHADKDTLLTQGSHSAAAWADAAVIIPWVLYLSYGDRQILCDQYESMKKWIEFMRAHADDYIWNYKLQFGDWVALDAEQGSYYGATPNDLTCTAFFAYSTGLFSKIAGVLGREEDREEYAELHSKIVKKYQATFFESDGTLKAQTQTAHIVSLHFGLTPEPKKTLDGLLALLQKNGGHLNTGFVGTPYFCFALSNAGASEEAYKLLLREDFPSWLYQVKKGATTVWEHWDGIKEDGSMWSPDMNSFNHYAYGAVGEWLFRAVAGIDTYETEPGFRHSIIAPRITSQINDVSCKYRSIYGAIEVKWSWEGGLVTLKASVPANTKSTIRLYSAEAVVESDGLSFVDNGCGYEAEAGSGDYIIKYKMS